MSAEVKAETRVPPRLGWPHTITGDADDAMLLTEKVERFDSFLGQADRDTHRAQGRRGAQRHASAGAFGHHDNRRHRRIRVRRPRGVRTLVFMDAGRIIEQGSPAEVIDAPHHERTREFMKIDEFLTSLFL
jgi:hypothetical protein